MFDVTYKDRKAYLNYNLHNNNDYCSREVFLILFQLSDLMYTDTDI